MSRRSHLRRPTPAWALGLATACLVFLVVESASSLALHVLEARGILYRTISLSLSHSQRETLAHVASRGEVYLDHDAELGWSPRPLGHSELYRANAAGLRAEREYPLVPPAGIARIAAFGDSYTHGDWVAFGDTWEARAETRLPAAEILNFGVSGYGLDQAYLRYLHLGRRYGAKVVLIGFMSGDYARVTSTFRLFNYHDSQIPFAKPRFRLENGALTLLPNPMQRPEDYARLLDGGAALAQLGANDFEYQRRIPESPLDVLATVRALRLAWQRWQAPPQSPPLQENGLYNPASEAFALNVALVDAFVAAVRADGARPLVVFFPGADALRKDPPPAYEPLRSTLEERGVPTFDTYPAVREADAESHDPPLYRIGHFSARGNDVVAAALAPRLAALAQR